MNSMGQMSSEKTLIICNVDIQRMKPYISTMEKSIGERELEYQAGWAARMARKPYDFSQTLDWSEGWDACDEQICRKGDIGED